MKLETITISILLLVGFATAQSYIWNGENQNTWDNQKLTASNDLGEDSVTVNQVCEWLEDNNPQGFENNCMVSSDLDWPEVSRVITNAQDSDVQDKWVKMSKLITCVESNNPPVSPSECDSGQEISPVVALISEDVSLDSDTNQDTDSEDGSETVSEDVEWNGWNLKTTTLDGKSDELAVASGDDKAVLDSGEDGYCGTAYFQKDFSAGYRTADKLEIDYNVVGDDWAGKAFVNVNGNEIESVNPQGEEVDESGTWTVYIASETNTIEFGIQDTSEDNCHISDHDLRLEVTDVSKSDTSIATLQ